MPVNFLKTLDGTGRAPFPLQAEFLAWLQKQKTRVIAGQLPTGVGKTFALATIQRATGAWWVAPSNMLVGQVEKTYPDINIVKGAAHYRCEDRSMSCGDAMELEMSPCAGCPYKTCRKAAKEGAPTIFNPISLHSLLKDSTVERPKVTIVDEAQTLIGMLLLVSGERFRSSKFKLPKSTDAMDVLAWLTSQEAKLARVVEHFNQKKEVYRAAATLSDLSRIITVREGLSENPQNYSIHLSMVSMRGKLEEVLHVIPLTPPRSLIDSVLGKGKVILLSATLSRMNVEMLFPGEAYSYIDMASPIPLEQRPILYRPMKVRANSQTDPRIVIEYVRDVMKNHPGENAIVHVTYGLSRLLAPHASMLTQRTLFNSQENKDQTIARFKKEGGIFFAAGCAAGLDLPDDECRVNIIPILHRQNPTDPAVKKWLALPGGRKRYDMDILETFQQQVGRSTRHIHDRSTTYVGDGGLPDLIDKCGDDLSKSFTSAIVWSRS